MKLDGYLIHLLALYIKLLIFKYETIKIATLKFSNSGLYKPHSFMACVHNEINVIALIKDNNVVIKCFCCITDNKITAKTEFKPRLFSL